MIGHLFLFGYQIVVNRCHSPTFSEENLDAKTNQNNGWPWRRCFTSCKSFPYCQLKMPCGSSHLCSCLRYVWTKCTCARHWTSASYSRLTLSGVRLTNVRNSASRWIIGGRSFDWNSNDWRVESVEDNNDNEYKCSFSSESIRWKRREDKTKSKDCRNEEATHTENLLRVVQRTFAEHWRVEHRTDFAKWTF